MKSLIVTIFCSMFFTTYTVYDFTDTVNIGDWQIVNDVVMGGRSSSSMQLDKNGHAVFSGDVSLKNYGGFCSVRHRFESRKINQFSRFIIRLKGDGKNYQLRIKSDARDRHTYMHEFKTTGEWQTIEVAFRDLEPSFRGRMLNMPVYSGDVMEEVGFLIANKQEESFRLVIDHISLK